MCYYVQQSQLSPLLAGKGLFDATAKNNEDDKQIAANVSKLNWSAIRDAMESKLRKQMTTLTWR